MRTINIVLRETIILSLAALLFFSCSKEGPQGIPGSPGSVGAVGSAGKTGASFLAGDGAPKSNTGDTGDYYLEKQTGNLYGPKTDKGWGEPLTLSGNGNGIILSGNGKPDTAFGMVGDFYLDTSGYLLYGPKLTGNNWGPALMLKGTGGSSGVRAYVITDPYDYFVDFDTSGNDEGYQDYGLSIPYDPKNNFNLWNAVKENNMITAYFKRNPVSFENYKPDTETVEMVPVNSTLDGSPAGNDYYYLGSHYSILEESLNIYFSNFILGRISKPVNNESRGNWNGEKDFKEWTAIKSIMIFVISPFNVSNLKHGSGRISHPEESGSIKHLLNQYLN